MRFPRFFLPCIASLWLAAGAALRADAPAAEPSPFLPPGAPSGGPGGAADTTNPELRGIMSTPQGMRYCIYDPAKKASTWSGVNEPGLNFVVKSADPANDAVVVQEAGRTYRLVMQDATITAMSGGFPGFMGNAPYLRRGPAVAPLSAAEEAARLQAVAEEVRRRRQLRMQNAQQGSAARGP